MFRSPPWGVPGRFLFELSRRKTAFSESEPVEEALQERLMMLSLRDISEKDFPDILRIDLIDIDDDERHEKLARFQDDLGREFVVGDPE